MTDKPTSKNSDSSTGSADKANTITKSTQKSSESSSENTAQVNMSNSTNAIESSPVEKNTTAQSNKKAVKKTDTVKPSASPQSAPSQKAKQTMKSKPTPTKEPEQKPKNSKLAILSLLIALFAVVGLVLLYFWHVQQQTEIISQLQQVKSDATKSKKLAQKQMMTTLKAQEQSIAMQFSDTANKMKEATQENIEQLNLMVEKFSQNQPTDWLVHEAEYLIRIAARTLWLEKDTTAAIGLLQDADARIAELNDPEILPIRQLIYQDIEALRLMPRLETEQVILSLMALGEQIQSLPLVTLTVPQETENADRYTLSEDISDWRQNMGKTWDRFMQTFVVVHSRVGDLEPILPAEQRQHLKENLNLKLQIAQWAASKGNHNLFTKSLDDAEYWLTQYFDLNDPKNKVFINAIESLKNKVIVVEDELKLVSLKAIRKALEDKKSIGSPVQSRENGSSLEHEVEAQQEPEVIVEEPQGIELDVTPEANSNISPETVPKIMEEQSTEQSQPSTDIQEVEIKKISEKVTNTNEAA
jgi:uroporphyrin-3 C-methyltransferase